MLNSTFSHSTYRKKSSILPKDNQHERKPKENKFSEEWEAKRRQSLVCSLHSDENSSPDNPEMAESNFVKGEKEVTYKLEEIQMERESLVELVKTIKKEKERNEEIFRKHSSGYLNYMKGLFVLKEIIDPIELENLLDLDRSEFLEFMFLVSLRAYNYLTIARVLLEKAKEEDVKSDLEQVYAYQFKAKKKFLSYDAFLNDEQKKFSKRLLSVKEVFSVSEKNKKKYNFLDGMQGLDYTTKEQIVYTYKNYMQTILNSPEIKPRHFLNHRLKKALKSYMIVCGIEEDDVNSKQEFECLQNRIMIEY